MLNIHTYPNGCAVTPLDGDVLSIESESGYCALTKDETDALRDFFLNELGLWRDEETGKLVVTKADRDGSRLVFAPNEPYYCRLRNGDGSMDDASDQAVARYLDTIAPPPREPKPGEVWRITLEDGTSRNVLVQEYATGAMCFEDVSDGGWYVSGFPADRRRLLVEADGTVCGDE